MFDNIGSKLKSLAKVIYVLGIIGFLIWGIVLCMSSYTMPMGIGIIVGGILSSLISAWVLYGIGEIADNSMTQVKQNEEIINMLKNMKKGDSDTPSNPVS